MLCFSLWRGGFWKEVGEMDEGVYFYSTFFNAY